MPDDVIVVGGGPVGLLAAALLAVEGVPSTVLERRDRPSSLPRAVHLDDEALRVLQRIGALPRLGARLSPMRTYELRDADGRLLHAFPREGGDLGHPPSVLFHQPDLEEALRACVAASSLVQLRWGHEVVDVDPGGAGVEVLASDGARGRIRGSAVLACDGAASTVRRLLRIPTHDRGFEQSWLVVDVHLEGRPDRLRNPQQRCDPARPATSVPVGRSRHRFEFMLLPGEDPAAVTAAVPELLAGWDLDPDVEIERCTVYTFHALDAVRWQQDRVLLLGDAAHQMPPFLGQGLCSGIRDAANLSWKLGLVHRGAASPALLETYEAERRPQVGETIRRTALLGRIITGRSPSAAMLRRSAAASLRGAPPLRRLVEGLQPPPLPPGPLVARRRGPGSVGRPFPQPPLADGGRPRPGDAVLGDGFALVGWQVDPLAGEGEAARRFCAALGIRVLRVGPPGTAGQVVDPGGALAAWFRRQPGDVALVRPDRVVLGVARAADGGAVAALLARLAPFVG